MALNGDFLVQRRGAPIDTGVIFAYPIAPGEKIWRGSACAINSANQCQRVQTAGSLAFIGLAERTFDNTQNSAPGPNIEMMKGTYQLTVPGATATNLLPGQNTVYATDDGTFTLSSAGAIPIGTLIGFGVGPQSGQVPVGQESGLTYVRLLGS